MVKQMYEIQMYAVQGENMKKKNDIPILLDKFFGALNNMGFIEWTFHACIYAHFW